MNNLFNVGYLTNSKLNFPRIGNLKFLQELKKFNVKNENGYRIEELEHMNELHILRIENLKSVRDAKEAYHSKLCDKRKLTRLSLNWGRGYSFEDVDCDLDESVLDNLQPHNYLKKLMITTYMGARSAIWMNEAHSINNLTKIQLHYCLDWEILPPFGQLPFLKTLMLVNMPKAKRLENKFHGNDMCCVFPSLETLQIWDMEAFVDWFDASVVDHLFPCLTKLHLHNCPNLQELPYLPPKLESLKIINIGWKTLNCCSISKYVPLRSLQVQNCSNITSISVEGEIGKLEFVKLAKLPQLQEYPDLPLPFIKRKIEKPKLHPKESSIHITIEEENDYSIEELELMNGICFLNIFKLQYVRDAEKAFNAKLCDKRKLIHLYLHWGDMNPLDADPDLHERVLDNLQPHNYLKTLRIYYYMGARSAIWMNEVHTINNLEEIQLQHCWKWEILPPFGLLPFLKILSLCEMPKVKRLENKFHGNDMCCCVFPSLQYLAISNLEALVDWFGASVVDGLFPCLTEHWLCDCPNLQELLNLPRKLESLTINNIGWKTLNCSSISKSIPLKSLKVWNFPNITSISLKDAIGNLEKLTIKDLPSLQSLPCSLANISSLEFLKLAKLPLLQGYPNPPPSLKKFHFS